MKKELENLPGEEKGSRTRLPRGFKLNFRAARFAELRVAGHTQAAAYRIAYNHPKMALDEAAEQGWRVENRRGVKERIADLRGKSRAKTLLTLNERLEVLAAIAQDPLAKQADKIRAIEAYSRIGGDQAPERHEISGVDGAPIAVAGTVFVGQTTVRERVEMLKAARAREGAR